MSTLLDYCRSQARYNRWANQQVSAAVARLGDAEYYEPLLPKAKPVHFVLNHILAIDKLWLGEIEDKDSGITSSVQMLHDDRDRYIADRVATDADIVRIVDAFTEDDLAAVLYDDDPEEGPNEWPIIYELAHVFRHQVHHRGQITTLLSHSSVPAPKIDQLFIPDA